MYLAFKEKMSNYPIFSKADIQLQFPNLDNRRLTEWQKKGYIEKLRNSFYQFSDRNNSEFFRYLISNTIYQPSYVSLQSALSFHGYIPEATFSVTAVSTSKTKSFETAKGVYLYQSIQPAAFMGYGLISQDKMTIKMASPEKALVDLLHLDKKLRSAESICALRLQPNKMSEAFSYHLSEQYAALFQSNVLEKMMLTVKKIYASY